ncbi:hypothetical protein AWZ03_003979 [Drosophila navojoa]|uniref:Uncharacterized protein n=1 Tax=Drosophila navojoa TaxID=7232 RepID=A0A484BPU0_DRONA|nr:hypothetical protein AWZ03_003979 [Drosophila navojoa]
MPDPWHRAPGARHQAPSTGRKAAMCRSSLRIPCDVCLGWQGMWRVLALAAHSQQEQQSADNRAEELYKWLAAELSCAELSSAMLCEGGFEHQQQQQQEHQQETLQD